MPVNTNLFANVLSGGADAVESASAGFEQGLNVGQIQQQRTLAASQAQNQQAALAAEQNARIFQQSENAMANLAKAREMRRAADLADKQFQLDTRKVEMSKQQFDETTALHKAQETRLWASDQADAEYKQRDIRIREREANAKWGVSGDNSYLGRWGVRSQGHQETQDELAQLDSYLNSISTTVGPRPEDMDLLNDYDAKAGLMVKGFEALGEAVQEEYLAKRDGRAPKTTFNDTGRAWFSSMGLTEEFTPENLAKLEGLWAEKVKQRESAAMDVGWYTVDGVGKRMFRVSPSTPEPLRNEISKKLARRESLLQSALATKIAMGGLGNVQADKNGNVDRHVLYGGLLSGISKSSLAGFVPKDGAKFGITTGAPDEWAKFMTALSFRESRLNTKDTGDMNEPSIPGGSHGLFSLSPKDAVTYNMRSGSAQYDFSIAELQNPAINAQAAIRIVEQLVRTDGVIAEGGKGAAKYFGPLKRGENPLDTGAAKGLPSLEDLQAIQAPLAGEDSALSLDERREFASIKPKILLNDANPKDMREWLDRAGKSVDEYVNAGGQREDPAVKQVLKNIEDVGREVVTKERTIAAETKTLRDQVIKAKSELAKAKSGVNSSPEKIYEAQQELNDAERAYREFTKSDEFSGSVDYGPKKTTEEEGNAILSFRNIMEVDSGMDPAKAKVQVLDKLRPICNTRAGWHPIWSKWGRDTKEQQLIDDISTIAMAKSMKNRTAMLGPGVMTNADFENLKSSFSGVNFETVAQPNGLVRIIGIRNSEEDLYNKLMNLGKDWVSSGKVNAPTSPQQGLRSIMGGNQTNQTPAQPSGQQPAMNSSEWLRSNGFFQ